MSRSDSAQPIPEVKVGRRVRVLRGRNAAIGTEGVVIWMAPRRRGAVSRRIGIRLGDGSVAWANDNHVQVVIVGEGN